MGGEGLNLATRARFFSLLLVVVMMTTRIYCADERAIEGGGERIKIVRAYDAVKVIREWAKKVDRGDIIQIYPEKWKVIPLGLTF